MKSSKKTAKKSNAATPEEDQDQLSETRRRLKLQKEALKKIIEQFSKKEKDK